MKREKTVRGSTQAKVNAERVSDLRQLAKGVIIKDIVDGENYDAYDAMKDGVCVPKYFYNQITR